MSNKDIAQTIIDTLQSNGVGAYIYCEATTSSVYVRFTDARISSIRIADHDGRKKYRYKWNVRTDRKFVKKGRKGWIQDQEVWRYFTTADQLDELISLVLKRAEVVKTWENTYTYGNFKKKGQENPEPVTNQPDDIW